MFYQIPEHLLDHNTYSNVPPEGVLFTLAFSHWYMARAIPRPALQLREGQMWIDLTNAVDVMSLRYL